MYPSETAEAKRQRSRVMRKRLRDAGMTEIVLVLPKSCVDQLDAQKSHRGLRNRGQVVEQLLSTGRTADQQSIRKHKSPELQLQAFETHDGRAS